MARLASPARHFGPCSGVTMRWLNRVVAQARARIEGRHRLQRAISNSFWLFSEQFLKMAAGLLVGVWTARYLGPERYGWLNYAIAIVGMVATGTELGVNRVVVRELVTNPQQTAQIMGTALSLRGIGAFAGLLICAAVAAWRAHLQDPTPALIVVVSVGLVLQLGNVTDLLLQSMREPRVSAWIRMISILLTNSLRVALIFLHAAILYFAAATAAEHGLNSLGWWWVRRQRGWRYRAWRGERDQMLSLLRESWPLAVSGLAVYAQAYADQIVIGSILGGSELGQYAAAIRIVSVFSFIPMVIQTVAAVEITRSKVEGPLKYRRRLHNLYRLMMALFLVVAVPLSILGPWLTRLLYGRAYAGASPLLPWLALRLFFTNFGVARGIYITNENLFKFALITAIAGGVTNIALNLVLVPSWGARGAIAASLISFFITTFGLEPFEPRARQNLWLMLQAIFLPWRRLPQEG
ncbi:MAG: flippase [Proteobacteria bacterium]|nr:flippase [Pseudomonadota bacterium]